MSVRPTEELLATMRRPLIIPLQSAPVVSDNALRLMIQCARHGRIKLNFKPPPGDHSGWLGRAVDVDGVEHRRTTVNSWGTRGMFRVVYENQVATVELTINGIKWLQYLRDLLNEVPL